MALRRAAAGVEWQVVAATGDVDDAIDALARLHARILLLDAEVAAGADEVVDRLRTVRPDALLVGFGDVAGAHAMVPTQRPDELPGVLAALLHARGDHRH